MFTHSVVVWILRIMFWTVVLLTSVFCKPVAQDPVLGPKFDPDTNGNQLRSDLLPLVTLERSNIYDLNKMSVVKNTQNNGNHQSHVSSLSTNGERSKSDSMENEHFADFGDTEISVNDGLFDTNERRALDRENIQSPHTDIASGHGFSFFNKFSQRVQRSMFAGRRKTDKIRQFRRNAVPEVDLDIDRGVFKQFSHAKLNLQALYEKKGGVCMLIQGYRRSPLYVITKCPLLFRHNLVRNLCEYVSPASKKAHRENIIEITNSPVQDRHGFVYRNVYCAECHSARGVQAWATSLMCDDMQQLVLTDGQHDVTFMGEFVDKTQGCRRVLAPVTTHGLHECEESEIVGVMRHWHETRMGENSKSDHSPFPLSFTLFMNFGFDGKTHILFSTAPTDQLGYNICDDNNEMYDPVNNKCRVISCTNGYKLVEGSCQKTETYAYDSTQDFDFSQTEEPLQVVLTLRNISYGMVYLLSLPGIELVLADALASEVNISIDRIQNINVTILNNTDVENGTLKNDIEVHRFTSTELAKLMQTSTYSKQKTDATSHNTSETIGSINEISKLSHPDNSSSLLKQKEISIDRHLNTSDKESVDTNTDSFTNKHNAIKDKEDENDNIASTGNGSPEKGHIDAPVESTDQDKDYWSQDQHEYCVRIAFILKEAHRNTTDDEKSVKSIVDLMYNLILNNSFSLTVNGTDFQVQGLKNAPPPASLDNFCTKGYKTPFYDQTEFAFMSYYDDAHNKTNTIVYVNQTDRTYLAGEYDLTVSFDGIMTNLSRTQMDAFVIVCDTPKIKDELCPRIYLERDEYQTLDNFSIYFANKTFNLNEYEYNSTEDESIIVCAPDWSDAQRVYSEEQRELACGNNMITFVLIEGYLTFILGLISIVSMLTVLITYSLFERLRNLPGVNTMNLTLSLFLGELVFMLSGWIQPRVAWLCSGVGILLHYLFLASFFWMNIMAFDVYRTFAKKCILRRIRSKKKNVPRYVLYAWGSPLLIVAVCVFLDFSNAFDGVDIGYGGSSFVSVSEETFSKPSAREEKQYSEDTVYNIGCWIQRPVASMVAFGGPMMLILFGNVVMFTRTIICIRASTKSTRVSVRRESLNHLAGRDDVMLYIRMSTVMGFTWIFGLASSVVSAFAGSPTKVTCILLHLLGILFIILNCSQGIFIFFAFVCNRRVLDLYRRLFRKLKEGRKRPLSESTSRTTIYSVTTTVSTTSQRNISVCT